MPTSRSSVSIEATPDEVFAFVRDVTTLPQYLAPMRSASPAGGEAVRVTAEVAGQAKVEEAWFRVHEGHRRRVEWGAEGPAGYRGWLEVDREGDVASVTVELHVEHGTAEELDRSVDASLFALKRRIEQG